MVKAQRTPIIETNELICRIESISGVGATGEIYAQDGKLDYIHPTVSTNTDTLTARAARLAGSE